MSFLPDPMFERNVRKFKGTVNPVGNAVREATDEIGNRVKELASSEAGTWAGLAASSKGIKTYKDKGLRLIALRAKAMAYSLKAYARTVRFVMVAGADEDYGAVVSYHAAGAEIEFGGNDPKLTLGDTGVHLSYPAFAFMRRGLGG